MIGNEIDKFLKENGVTRHQLVDGTTMQTSVALAFLDDNGDARYEFYKQHPKDPDLSLFDADFQENDILLFGSYYAIMPEIREGVRQLVSKAHQKGAIVIYDPNFRRPHLKDLPKVKGFIEENIRLADIVKGSNEDFELIFNNNELSTSSIFEVLRSINRNTLIFYTKGKDGCMYYHRGITLDYPVPQIKPVSTIGAGDNFNAGIVYGIVKNNITRNDLHGNIDVSIINDIVNHAVAFSQEVCMSNENYIRKR
jgi:fructokinase